MERHEAIGQARIDEQKIRIAEGLSDQCDRSTLLHEVLHFLDRCLKLGLSEEDVARLEAGLNQVLNDNPKFVDLWALRTKKGGRT
jgi:hypothetical protein